MSASAIRRAAIKETKARFSRLLRHPAWKPSGPIVVSALYKFVTYLLSNTDIAVADRSRHTAAGTHVPYGITQCYLQPGRGDIPALAPAEAGTLFSDPGGMHG